MKLATFTPWALLALVLTYPLFGQGTLTKLSSFRGPFQVEGIPTPQQMMRVVGGTPFTVPAGKLLVVTGARHLGSPNFVSSNQEVGITVMFNSASVAFLNGRWLSEQGGSGRAGGNGDMNIPPGLTAPEGTVVDVTGGVLLSYLVDA